MRNELSKKPYRLIVSNVIKRTLGLVALLYSSFLILHSSMPKNLRREKPLIIQNVRRGLAQVAENVCITTVSHVLIAHILSVQC